MKIRRGGVFARMARALKGNAKFGNLQKKLGFVLASGMVTAGLLVSAQPASAVDSGPTISPSACMQRIFIGDNTNPVTNANKLNCTANDIRIARAISVSPSSCFEGETFDLTGTFEINVTANARYDAGFFFRTDGGINARGDGTTASGVCSLSALTPGIPPALNLEPKSNPADTCGDLNAGTYNVTFTIPDVTCTGVTDPNDPTRKILRLPNCTSWHNSSSPPDPACDITEQFDFDPDTKSKCVCDDTFTVPVIVETASLTVVKDVAPLSVQEPGGPVTYTVTVTNNASHVSVTIDSIDDCLGTVDSSGNCSGSTVDLTAISDCGANQPPPICTPVPLPSGDISCPSLKGTTLDPGASATCQFNAVVSGNSGDTVEDTVEVCGTDSNNHSGICGHDDASVDITDVAVAPTLTKTAQSAACTVDATYQVVVTNNSTVDPLTVDSLTDDKFGAITTAHAADQSCAGLQTCEQVVSTGCATGGTLGTFGSSNPSYFYSCTFVGRIIDSDCSVSHTDAVTGIATDDDGVTFSGADGCTDNPPSLQCDSQLKDSATVTVTTSVQ
jgi:hypothetical protein